MRMFVGPVARKVVERAGGAAIAGQSGEGCGIRETGDDKTREAIDGAAHVTTNTAAARTNEAERRMAEV